MRGWAKKKKPTDGSRGATDRLPQPITIHCVPTVHPQASIASHYGPTAAGPFHVRLGHIYDYGGEIDVALNLSESRVDGAIASGHENGRHQGDSGHAIAGIHHAGNRRDLLCRRNGAFWVKANDYRVAGVQVSESEVENRRDVCYCGRDDAPCARPFPTSLPLSPPCPPLCAVSVRPSPLPLSPHLDLHAHWSPPREGLGLHLYRCLVCFAMIPSWMAQNHCTVPINIRGRAK